MTDARHRLEQFLLHGTHDGLTVADLRRANLAAYAYAALPSGDGLRAELRGDFAATALRHNEIRAQLLPLLSACNRHGLEVVLYKGFAQAEFVYDAPAQRFYGDVDALIRASDAENIVAVALNLGWRVQYLQSDLHLLTTHPAVLMSPGDTVMLELHSTVLQTGNRAARRLTRNVLESAVMVTLGDVPVRVLSSTDALLVMYLNRAWGDLWGRKPHDYLDAHFLIARHGVTKKGLEARARDLRVGRVLALAMESCDPWQRRLQLGRAARARVWGWGLRAFPSWGAFAVELVGVRVRLLPLAVRLVREAWGRLRDADAALRQHLNLNTALESLTPQNVAAGDPQRLSALTLHMVIGLRWALRLQRRGSRSCVPRSLALYRALRLRGYAVSFVSGVERSNQAGSGTLQGHAWVEWQGRPLSGTGDETAPARFKVLFRYPAAD